MEHNYCDWHKALSKELCDYMGCFEKEPNIEDLCFVEKLAKTIKTLYEIEAYEIMFDCLEDCFGYDRDEHEFEDKDNGGADYVIYSIMNRYDPTRMTSGTSRYPTTTRGGQSYGRDYGTGADHRYGERYNERSTDKSMYQPYGMDYGMGGWMNMADGDRNRMMDDRRTGERNGERNGDRTGSRDRDWDSRSGERGMERSRGRYMNAAERKETKEKLHKLSDKDKEEWMDSLVGPDGDGPMFTKEEVMAAARKMNIKFDDFSELDLTLVTNMMYSDYAQTAKKMNVNRLDFYVSLAKDFLEDEDSVDPEKKLAAYREYIVEEDD